MGFPVRTCVKCGDEFELRPGKPGFANRCPECSAPEGDGDEKQKADAGLNEARRDAMKNLLYRKDS